MPLVFAPRFPDRLPKATVVAYAQSYGGVVGGHAFLALSADRSAWVSCRFERPDTPPRRVGILPEGLLARWMVLLDRAELSSIRSDDPSRPVVETPELWFLRRGRVTYIQTFAHDQTSGRAPTLRADPTLTRLQPITQAFQKFLDESCRSRVSR